MSSLHGLLRFSSAVFLVCVIALLPATAWPEDRASCDIQSGETFNVLSINILFSEYERREERLRALADFIAAPFPNEPGMGTIHVVALQEVSGGFLDFAFAEYFGVPPIEGTTAEELTRILEQDYGLAFNLRSAFSSGLQGVYGVSNAMLSRCAILGPAYIERLPETSELTLELEGETATVEVDRNVLMVSLDIPQFGQVNAYTTHLCSECLAEERLRQGEQALAFIRQQEAALPSRHTLFMGDFNTNVLDDAQAPLYNAILEAGLVDTYAQYTQQPASCIPQDGALLLAEGCTVDVSDIRDPFSNTPPTPARVDYIFSQGDLDLVESRVVFNPLVVPGALSVSDHSGVLARFLVPPAE